MSEPALKKRCVEEEKEGKLAATHFKGFKLIKILLNDAKSKRVHVHGKFHGSDEEAVITLVKSPFSEDSVNSILSEETTLQEEFKNDIYGQYIAQTKPQFNGITTQIIHPATEKHLIKYADQKMYLLNETADQYKNITLPFLEKQKFSIEWVYNILDHKKESERIIYEDPCKTDGFILIPDFKWDGKQIEDLYLMAVCHRRDVKSIRDLDHSHLKMLKNIYESSMKAIKEKYDIPSHQIRAYFHYYPTYYHLHVHFNHIKYDVGGINVGKAHLLLDVIDNIENIDKEFYKKKCLPITLRENDPLLQLLKGEE